MTTADIQQLCTAAKEQGVEIRVSPAGAVLIRPLDMERRALTPTERTRARRARLAETKNVSPSTPETTPNETDSVSPERENETNETNETLKRESPSPPLPPPPLSPTPPIPAPAHTPTPGSTRRERTREDEADFAAACAHTLDMTASPKLRQAWAEWQVYRQRLHRQTGALRKLWTLQAARLSANLIVSNAEQHGEQIVTDRIAAAIAGNWQGLNFDKLATNGNHTRGPSQVSRNTSPLPSAGSLNATSYKATQPHVLQDDE